MIYTTKEYKNGKVVGYLRFDSGKNVYLNEKERKDLETKIRLWNYEAIEKRKHYEMD